MRTLTAGQKKLLRETYAQNHNITDADDLPVEVWDRLVDMNDTEVLFAEVNNYLWELIWRREDI